MDITRQNFISTDGKTARNSYDQYFTVGEVVKHQDETVGEATILKFLPVEDMNEIRAHTDKGYAYIDFSVKIKE